MLLDFKLSVLSLILSKVLFVTMSLEGRRCAELLAAFRAFKALFKDSVYRNDPEQVPGQDSRAQPWPFG